MIQEFINDPLNKAWPFWVLGLVPECSSQDINKASQLIASKLSLGVPDAEFFYTPAGTKSRDSFLVREAKSILDDPAQRLIAEFWYVPPQVNIATSSDQESSSTPSKPLSAKQWLITLGLKWAV
jgi:hypothetical protein